MRLISSDIPAGGSVCFEVAKSAVGRPARANGAIGRYQHMPPFVKGRVIAAGFKGSDRFTPEVQDRTTLHFLYTSHSYRQWRSGQLSDEELMYKDYQELIELLGRAKRNELTDDDVDVISFHLDCIANDED